MTKLARTVRVGRKGQVVIPKEIREELGIDPGEDVLVDSVEGAARVRRVPAATQLLGLLEDGASTADIEAEHRAEREHEEAKLRMDGLQDVPTLSAHLSSIFRAP